jgi:hypothetical protein
MAFLNERNMPFKIFVGFIQGQSKSISLTSKPTGLSSISVVGMKLPAPSQRTFGSYTHHSSSISLASCAS